eukprot:TRINITY_DN2861_c0_g2_i6.p2 TRINITY_DN2861_c0_g2~~TRINITY_DN2861_c0_g2_i6.p2  ORF type:complete len:303 (-),score=44.71 TRINITY_DN2861_c0_g2_i6:2952-3860(-)
MLRGCKFDHIAFAVSNTTSCFGALAKLRGLPRKGGDDETFRGGQWTIGNEVNSVLEFIEPVGTTSDNFLRRYIDRHGAGLHHITFIVPSLRDVMLRAKHYNLEVVSESFSKPHWLECFLHPRHTFGIAVQLVEVRSDTFGFKAPWSRQWLDFSQYKVSDSISDSGVRLRGLHVWVPKTALPAANILFGTVLGGDAILGHLPSYSAVMSSSGSLLDAQSTDAITTTAAAGAVVPAAPAAVYRWTPWSPTAPTISLFSMDETKPQQRPHVEVYVPRESPEAMQVVAEAARAFNVNFSMYYMVHR